jgi:hypothetical protein
MFPAGSMMAGTFDSDDSASIKASRRVVREFEPSPARSGLVNQPLSVFVRRSPSVIIAARVPTHDRVV